MRAPVVVVRAGGGRGLLLLVVALLVVAWVVWTKVPECLKAARSWSDLWACVKEGLSGSFDLFGEWFGSGKGSAAVALPGPAGNLSPSELAQLVARHGGALAEMREPGTARIAGYLCADGYRTDVGRFVDVTPLHRACQADGGPKTYLSQVGNARATVVCKNGRQYQVGRLDLTRPVGELPSGGPVYV